MTSGYGSGYGERKGEREWQRWGGYISIAMFDRFKSQASISGFWFQVVRVSEGRSWLLYPGVCVCGRNSERTTY